MPPDLVMSDCEVRNRPHHIGKLGETRWARDAEREHTCLRSDIVLCHLKQRKSRFTLYFLRRICQPSYDRRYTTYLGDRHLVGGVITAELRKSMQHTNGAFYSTAIEQPNQPFGDCSAILLE